jgi:hypothetical protein
MRRSPLVLLIGGLAAILAVALLVVTILGEGQRGGAHQMEETAPAPAPPGDVTSGGYRLAVSLSPEEGMVGEVVTITGRVTDPAGAPVRNVRFELVSHHLEDDVDIFRTTFVSPDGTFSWGNQFWDGTEHEIRVTAGPGPDASAQFTPLTLRREVAVEPVPPPVGVQLRAMVWLLLPVVLGLAVGVPLGLRSPARRRAPVRGSTAPA